MGWLGERLRAVSRAARRAAQKAGGETREGAAPALAPRCSCASSSACRAPLAVLEMVAAAHSPGTEAAATLPVSLAPVPHCSSRAAKAKLLLG